MSRRKVFLGGSLALLTALALAVLFLLPSPSRAAAPAQDGKPQATNQTAATYRGLSTVAKFDVSPPLRSIAPISPMTGPPKDIRPEEQAGTPSKLPPSKDTVLQKLRGSLLMPTPIVNFDGPSNTCNCSPPDPNGEAGPNHFVVMTNLSFQIYNKTGGSLYGPAANNTLWTGFGGACQSNNDGDPVVLYDQLADRWLLSQFTAGPSPYFNCVALSTTGDPTGSYYRWAFTTNNNFPDYPKYGMNPDAYFISTREFAGGSSFVGVGAYAGNRAQMIAGNPSPQLISFLAPPSPAYNVGDGLLPADLDGTTPPPAGSPEYYLGSMDNNGPYGAPQDALTLWKFHVDFSNPPNSSFTLANTIATAPLNTNFPCGGGRSCIPQPGTTNKIDMLASRQRPIFRLAYRNFGDHESLVTNQSVDAGAGPGGDIAGVRWYELRSPNSNPVIYQQGTYAPGLTDGIHRWMGSIAMDHNGNMALGYSASSSTVYPSIYYTGRLSTDPLGQMPQGEAVLLNGTGSQTGSQRWGDYTDMTVDPTDDCTFWYVNEYVPTTSSNGWRSHVGSFKFPGCAVGTATPTVTGTPPTLTPTPSRTSSPTATATPCGISLISENFDTGTLGVFTSTVGTCTPGGCGWNAVASPTPHSAPDSAFAPDLNNISDQYLSTISTYTIPAGATAATLSFWHNYNLENTFDGGVLEFSTDAGATWHDVLTFTGNSFTQNGYVATISTGFSSPIAGRQAWTGNSSGYVQTIVNLQGLIGQTFKMRFREANDLSVSAVGWNVDDVLLFYGTPCAPTSTATRTSTPTGTATHTRTVTATPGSPTATPTECTINFSDVHTTDYFYNDVRCVYCLGAVSGYADGTFRPFNNTTRGQMTKIIVIALSIPISTPTGTPTFNDVPANSPFYAWIETSASHGIVSGYNCGGVGEPCPGLYYRPNANVTRGQLSKIVVVAASQVFHWDIVNPTTPTFTDVAPGSPFYSYIETAVCHGVISGYADHTFRPGNNAIRAQIAKIVCNTSQNPVSTCPAPPTATATATSTPAAGVSIFNFGFNPQTVTVTVGSRVEWTNTGAANHTATSDSPLFDSGTLSTGQSYSFTFDTAGSYPYHCAIHPSMHGTVNVTAGLKPDLIK